MTDLERLDPLQWQLLQDVLDNPMDDGPRLIYADYCEDSGDEERAEFIRLEVSIYSAETETTLEDIVRSEEILKKNEEKWRQECLLLEMKDIDDSRQFADREWSVNVEYERGFVKQVSLASVLFTDEYVPDLFSLYPIEKVILSDKFPIWNDGLVSYCWQICAEVHHKGCLPYKWSTLLSGRENRLGELKLYDSPEDAHSDLSVALVKYGRKLRKREQR